MKEQENYANTQSDKIFNTHIKCIQQKHNWTDKITRKKK